jgi:SpoVK/Ycf46/Vps4 family AAA+-type ATPase
MDDAHDLSVILKSRFPIVIVETHEESRVLALLEKLTNLEEQALFTWSVTEGLNRHGSPGAVPATTELTEALRHINRTIFSGLYVFLDAHPFLKEPINQRLVREIAIDYAKAPRTQVFVSARVELPNELMRMSARFQLKMPDTGELWQMLMEEIQAWERESGQRIQTEPDVIRQFARHLNGLCHEDARRLIREAIAHDGAITRDDLNRIPRFKQHALDAGSTLSLELDTCNFDQVGGLKALKRWLDVRRKAFVSDPETTGIDRPKGILLTGVQGSGKSLAAKAVAGSWGLPLVRLDFATLYNKFFGETERNLREALTAAEGMQPCVLWVDEIEKGLATDHGSGVDGGVSRRVLGTLLTWLAERNSRVFIVATANDIQHLPPELLRKGRFDEIFFVDLPDAATRADIFRIHLKRRKLDPARFDLNALALQSDGFAGAEVEQAIVSALYEAFAEDRPLTTAMVAAELTRTRPLSVVMAERMSALRAWARDRAVRAD